MTETKSNLNKNEREKATAIEYIGRMKSDHQKKMAHTHTHEKKNQSQTIERVTQQILRAK